MKAIWKFSIKPNDYVVISMPLGAKPLHVDIQRGQPCLWALVDPSAPMQDRAFLMAGTGHPLADDMDAPHIGTWQMEGGSLVFHLFDLDA